MKKVFKKSVAVVAAVSMVTALNLSAFAATETRTGTQDSVSASGSQNITVKGDVENGSGSAVNVSAASKSDNASVTVEGKITSTGFEHDDKYAQGTQISVVKVSADGGKASATVKDVSVEATLSSEDFDKRSNKLSAKVNGIKAESSNSGSASVTANGNINIETHTATDSTASSKIKTNVNGYGIRATADSNGTTKATVNGNITASSDDSAYGVYTSAGDNSTSSTGTVNVTVNGNISSSYRGVSADDLGSDSVTVNGNVNGDRVGISVVGDGAIDKTVSGTANVTVNGDVTSNKGTGISVGGINNKANVTVDGDVTGSQYGLYVYDNYGDVNIITDGTVSGSKAAIIVSNSVGKAVINIKADGDEVYTGDAKNSKNEAPNITVWKLESSSSNLIVAETKTYNYKKDTNGKVKIDDDGYPEVKESEEESTYTTNKELANKVAQSINYIIKGTVTENGKDTTNGKIVLKGTSGKVTVGDKTYQTAHQDETITINVETVSGYKYSLKNGEALLKANSNGTYTLKVPAGGGVDLKAVLEKIQESTDSSSSSSGSSSNRSSSSSGGSGSGGGSGSVSGYVKVGSSGIPDAILGSTGSGSSIVPTPGAWSKDVNNNWIFVNASGSSYKNDWIAANNRWYYLNNNGNPMTGWQQIKGIWYYFAATDTTANPLGSMYVSATTPDGYKVDATGAYIK